MGKKHATYAGGNDPKPGRVYTGCSSNPSGCAENDIDRPMGRGPQAPQFTKRFGWRRDASGALGWREIPVCVACQNRYSPHQFPPDVLFDPDGRWSTQ